MTRSKTGRTQADEKRHQKAEAPTAGTKAAAKSKSKSKEIHPLEGMDLSASPHLEKMSPSWQRLYAAVSRAVN